MKPPISFGPRTKKQKLAALMRKAKSMSASTKYSDGGQLKTKHRQRPITLAKVGK